MELSFFRLLCSCTAFLAINCLGKNPNLQNVLLSGVTLPRVGLNHLFFDAACHVRHFFFDAVTHVRRLF